MSSDVYVLASPTPTLYAYPSALHPQAPTLGGGAPFQPYRPYPLDLRPRLDDDETALAVLGAI